MWLRFSILLLFAGVLACAGENNTSSDAGESEASPVDTMQNKLTDEETGQGWMLLFDGVSTDQWRGYNQASFPETGWRVEDGHLVVGRSDGTEEAGGGSIITIEQYQDFVLSFDFLMTDTANSGVFYLVQEFEDTPIWHNAPEYQILDDPTYTEMLGADWMPTHRTGENYDLQANDNRKLNGVGEWNTGMIRKSGDHVQHWLNGELVVEYWLRSPEWDSLVAQSKFKDYPEYGQANIGHIGLQDHGHEVRFSNLKIRTR